MKTVVVLGAAGRVGDAAARAFVAAGWRVNGVARNARTSELAPGVEAVRADAFDRASLIAACEVQTSSSTRSIRYTLNGSRR